MSLPACLIRAGKGIIMKCIDQGLQQRVWQRVQSAGATIESGPEGLLLEERQDTALLRHLGHKTLAAHGEHRASVLQGICRLSGLPDATVLPKAECRTDDAVARRRIMEGLLRRVRQYEQLEETHYGPLYRELADHARKSCTLLATYIGATPLRNRE